MPPMLLAVLLLLQDPIAWETSMPAALKQAEAGGRPVLIFFGCN